MQKLIISAIEKRFSCRLFDAKRVIPTETIDKLILSASKAPSGKNGQPWRFRILNESDMLAIAHLLTNNKWIEKVRQAIAVFMDVEVSYDREKDAMAIGACIENMILAAVANDIDSCWIGECTEYRNEISGILNIPNKYCLMAIVVIGYGQRKLSQMKKKPIKKLMV